MKPLYAIGQSRVYRVMQLRTDGVNCRESAGTGSVNLKVVPNECCLGRSPWTNSYAPLFPTTTVGIKWALKVPAYVCMNVCMCITFHITAQSDPVILLFYATRIDPPKQGGINDTCMYVCIFFKLHTTAQSGPVIRVILCHSH